MCAVSCIVLCRIRNARALAILNGYYVDCSAAIDAHTQRSDFQWIHFRLWSFICLFCLRFNIQIVLKLDTCLTNVIRLQNISPLNFNGVTRRIQLDEVNKLLYMLMQFKLTSKFRIANLFLFALNKKNAWQTKLIE